MSTTETMTTGAVGYPNGVAAPREFPAMPNFADEHIAAVRRYLNGGRTIEELELMARGRMSHPSRFTPAEIRSIRTRHANGETQKSIAVDYGVYQSTISMICRRVNYKEVA